VHSKLSESEGGKRAKANWPLEEDKPGTGRMRPPSITVHALDAQGDVPPLRTIQGPKTQLNWPTGLTVDRERGEIFVANDMTNAVLVFRETDQGDVAPTRVLRGQKTGLSNPTGVYFDPEHRELWVANFGSHALTVYSPTAAGDTAPLRTIRSAPADVPSLMIGNPGAVAYDSKREQILVPN
jgi:DNA-binding beta-propeller fold protein YncE